MSEETKLIRGYCTANEYISSELKLNLEKKYKVSSTRDVIQVTIGEEAEVFLFSYGCVVFWNCGYDEEKFLLDEISKSEVEPLSSHIVDQFEYFSEPQEGSFKIHLDTIRLAEGDTLEKLSISHAIAQSTKLAAFEELVQKTIENDKYIPEMLSKTGAINLSKKQIAKDRGRLFLVKSKISLHYGLLDTPEFFWEYPELESFYKVTANYLEVKQRVDVLNKKLDIVQELLNMLADEQQHKHSASLEWIIIILIAFEVAIVVINEIIKVLG